MEILGLFDQVKRFFLRIFHPIFLEKGFRSHQEILERPLDNMRLVSYGAVWRHSLNCNEPGQSGSREGRRQSEAVPLHKLLAVIWALALIPAWIILFGRKQMKPRILWISKLFLAYGILYRIVLPEIYINCCWLFLLYLTLLLLELFCLGWNKWKPQSLLWPCQRRPDS